MEAQEWGGDTEDQGECPGECGSGTSAVVRTLGRPSLPEDVPPPAALHPHGDRSVDEAAAATLNCSEAELGSLILQHDRRQNGCLDLEDTPLVASPSTAEPDPDSSSPKPSQNIAVQVRGLCGKFLSGEGSRSLR